jgi:hypothetical protein
MLVLVSCTDYDIDEILAAPEQLDVNGYSFELESHLHRDMMPNPQEPEGGDLVAGAYIWSIDDNWPAGFDADHIWVINNDEIWDEKLTDAAGPIEPELLTKKAESSGPKWGPDINVDVVVRIIDDSDNTYLLKESDVLIEAIY